MCSTAVTVPTRPIMSKQKTPVSTNEQDAHLRSPPLFLPPDARFDSQRGPQTRKTKKATVGRQSNLIPRPVDRPSPLIAIAYLGVLVKTRMARTSVDRMTVRTDRLKEQEKRATQTFYKLTTKNRSEQVKSECQKKRTSRDSGHAKSSQQNQRAEVKREEI